jgi:predicted DsbA family dithiol-disulfide isomerase
MVFWAGLEGKQTAMVSALFRAYWRDEADIGDPATLAGLAGTIGLDAAAMARLLASDADRDAILSRDAHARQRGVTGVPCFVVANQYVLSGAQPVSLWQQAMDELIAAQKGTA